MNLVSAAYSLWARTSHFSAAHGVLVTGHLCLALHKRKLVLRSKYLAIS